MRVRKTGTGSIAFREFGEAVLGKQVVERLPEQGLDGRVAVRCEAAQLPAHFGTEIAGHACLADAAGLAVWRSSTRGRSGIGMDVPGSAVGTVGLVENGLSQVSGFGHDVEPLRESACRLFYQSASWIVHLPTSRHVVQSGRRLGVQSACRQARG